MFITIPYVKALVSPINHRHDVQASFFPKCEQEKCLQLLVMQVTKPNSFNWHLVLNLNVVMGEDHVVFGAHIAVGSYFIVRTLINNAELFV